MKAKKRNGRLKILMITSEAVPFAKAGGLADAVSALSAAAARAGHDVRIVMPRYRGVNRAALRPLAGPLGIPLGTGEWWTAVYETALPQTEAAPVPVYFLEHDELFQRAGIYGDRAQPSYWDNATRFALLSRGAFQLCRKLAWIPDVFHAHDWPAGLVPLYRNTLDADAPFHRSATVFTIHNLGYQGIFRGTDFAMTGVDQSQFRESALGHRGDINFMKSAIVHADKLTTVSPGYAREIQTERYGFSLDPVIRERANDLAGILNGMDYNLWNPISDPFLPIHYSSSELENKARLKALLQTEAGLVADPAIPVFGMVSRLVEQKGVRELAEPGYGALPAICRTGDVQVIIQGTGEARWENYLAQLDRELPNLKVFLTFNNRIAHLIEAGSDFFLMPSTYEPCGLNQMYSLAYGTIPVVTRTGGLSDTVTDYTENPTRGTGFMMESCTPWDIRQTVDRARTLFATDRNAFETVRERGMAERFTWDKSVDRYVDVYRAALEKRKGSP